MAETHSQSPVEEPPSPAPEFVEDAGSRALSDALRSSFTIIRIIMVLLVVVFFCSGLRVVGPQEKGIILRFGKPVVRGADALLGPGAHWAFPYPIDELVRIPMGRVQTIGSTIGWYATTAAMEAAGQEPQPGPSLNPAQDGYLLTADENIVHVRGTLRYRVAEPGLRYEFAFAGTSNVVANAFNSALVYAATRYAVDDILTRDFAGFRETVETRMNQLIGLHDLGVVVDQVELQAIAPRQLTAKFAAVLESVINRGRVINDAKSYANQKVSRATAQAEAIRSGGEADRKRLVEFVSAEARRFEELLPAYERNPELFVSQHKIEVLRRVLTNAQEKIVLPARNAGKPYELRLEIGRTPRALRTVAPKVEQDEH